MTQMAVYPSQTSIASSLISSSHNNHGRYANPYPHQKIGPWKFGPELGRGSTSKVILGVHETSGQEAAIKIVNKNHLDTQELAPHEIDSAGLPYGIQREIIIMKLLNNQNVLKLYDVYESKNHIYLITEYVSNGELFDYLVSVDPLPEQQAVAVFYELINGVFFLHNWGIVHRDLKLENILIDHQMHLKIADFGMATLELLKYSNSTSCPAAAAKTTTAKTTTAAATGKCNAPSTTGTTKKVPAFLLETSCGSPHYAAPEVISAQPYNGLKSDMWSCGVIFYALLTGKLPFDDENITNLLLKVKSGVFSMPSHLSAEAKELLSNLLCLDPLHRLDADGVLKSNLFRKHNLGFYSTEKSQHEYYANMNVFTNSINQDLIKTNNQNHLIINNYNFNKRIQSNPRNVNPKILDHLQILYHNKKNTQDIVENLVNNKVNIDKVFYSLLASFGNASGLFLTDSTRVENDYHSDSDLEESYPAQLHLNRQKMTKAYSNISIIASSAHKRNVSFNKKLLNKPHSLYRSGSVYRYSKNNLRSRMKVSNSISSRMKVSNSIASRMKSNNSIASRMKISNSIASYNGSLNLSHYLNNPQHHDFEDDEEEELEFEDEPINVVSPGVPVFKFAKSNIQDLTASYEKLQLLAEPAKDNFDFEATNDQIKQINKTLLMERMKQKELEKDIESTLNYSVNYKISPKRNKRYKTSSLIPNADNTYYIKNQSPTKAKHRSKKPQSEMKESKHSRKSMKNSISRKSMKPTLSSKIIASYAHPKNGYLDEITTETKSEFEMLCDQFFGRSNEGFQSMFGESYIDRKAREAKEKRDKLIQEQKLEQKRLEEKKLKEKNDQLTLEDVKLLANNQSLGLLTHKGPVSRLDPGLRVANFDKDAVIATATVAAVNKNKPRKSSKASRMTPSSFQSSNESLIFTPSNDIFEPTDLSASANAASLDSKSVRNFSALTEADYYDLYSKPEQTPQLLSVAKIRKAKRNSSRKSSRLQEIVYDDANHTYVEESTEDLEHDFEFVTPTSNSAKDTEDDLCNVGDSTKDLVRRTLNCEVNYKDYYKHSVPEITDASKSPFYQKQSRLEPPLNPLMQRILKEEIPHSDSQAAMQAAAAELSKKTGNVKIFVDLSNSNDSSCNLITNGVPGSSRNLALMSNGGHVSKRPVPVNMDTKPARNSSLFRKLSFANRKKPLQPAKAAEKPVLATIKESEPKTAARLSSYETNKNKNKELLLTLSKTQALVAIKSLLVNWKKYGIRDVKVKDNVISGGIKNSNGKVFLKKISSTTGFKIFVYEHPNGSKLELQKIKGSASIFDKFLVEIQKALAKEDVLV